MKKGLLLLLLISAQHVFSQYIDEALLYSRTGISGTARTIGSAGAYGSVGADLGSVTINPAGLGLYRSTDVCVTPALLITNNEAQFNGSFKSQSATKVSFNQAGISFTKLFKKANSNNEFTFNSTKLNSISFAINYQRQNNFSRVEKFDGYNSTSSAIDYFTNNFNSARKPITFDNYAAEQVLAYAAYLVDYDTITGNYFSNVHAPIQQAGTIVTRGGTDQIDLAFGGNVNDKFYFGLGLGIPILTYFSDASFSEYNSRDSLSGFQNYTVNSNLRVTGVGVNAKFGIIYRPVSWMRLGVAYHIPTYYALSETYGTTLTVSYDSVYSASQNLLKYNYRSPMKGVVSASFYIKEHGFFSADYEFLNYGSSHYNFGNDYKDFSNAINSYEKKYYTFGHVVRAGFEGSYKWLRVRTGYAFSSAPYKKDYITKNFTEAKHNATFGLGYRGKHFYADAAYVFGFTKDAHSPYADFITKNTLTSHSLFLTIGWKIFKEATAQNTNGNSSDRPRMKF